MGNTQALSSPGRRVVEWIHDTESATGRRNIPLRIR